MQPFLNKPLLSKRLSHLGKTQRWLALLFLLIFIGGVFFVSQVYKLYQLKHTVIDAKLKEVSGIEFDKKQRLWAINDGGNAPKLFHIQRDGQVGRSVTITNAKNIDWEDMTQDDFGHFFIGDFGNNDLKRAWLTIYKIENPIDIKTDETQAEIIKFAYSDLTKFAGLDSKNHDLEAFVSYESQLYLFTKNRSIPFDGKTYLFSIGDYAANHQARYIDSFTTCTLLKLSCWITSAALSPDKTKLVLLDSERLWLFENWQGDNFFSGDVYQVDLGIITQKESVTFFDDSKVVFTDEEFKGIGRNAYVIDLNEAEKVKIKDKEKQN